MKKFYSLIAVALMIVSAAAFVSCGNDKNDPVTEEDISDASSIITAWTAQCKTEVLMNEETGFTTAQQLEDVKTAVGNAVAKLINSKINGVGEVYFDLQYLYFSARPSQVSQLRTLVSQISQSEIAAAVNSVSKWESVAIRISDADGTFLSYTDSQHGLINTPTGTWASADGKYSITITDNVTDALYSVTNVATLTIDGKDYPGCITNDRTSLEITFRTDEKVGAFNLYLMECYFPAKDKTGTFVAVLMKGGTQVYENVLKDVTFTKQK